MHTPFLSLFASQVAALRATKAQPAKSRAVVVTRAAKDPRGVYIGKGKWIQDCLLYTSPSPRDRG